MWRSLVRLGVVWATASGCTASDPPLELIQEQRATLEGIPIAALIAKILPQTLGTLQSFGNALALEGDTLACGVEHFDDLAPRRGAIFVFERGADEFEQADVLGLDDRTGSTLGGFVVLEGATLATTEFNGTLGNRIAVYERAAQGFRLDARVAPQAPIPQGFGAALALSQDTIVASATVVEGEPGTGSAYVFVRGTNGWSEQARLMPGASTIPSFGHAVAIDGDLAAVGFPAQSSEPSVWLFERSAGQWTEQARLAASDSTAFDRFGQTLAISAGRVYVGAPRARNFEDVPTGAVYEFTKIAGAWVESKLAPSEVAPDAGFGTGLSAAFPRLLVGAPFDVTGGGKIGGAAYFFSAEAGEWAEPIRITAPDTLSTDEFGRAVALSGSTVVVGAPFHDHSEADRGAAYQFAIGLEPGSACATSADCAGICIDGMCCNRRCASCETCRASDGAVADGTCTSLEPGTAVAGCAPMLCAGTSACPPDCRSSGCSQSHFCDLVSGACLPRRDSGAACSAHEQCGSNFCDAGICCERTCLGCSSCRSEWTGVMDGICAPVMAGTDPHQACQPDPGFPASCGADGACDGGGHCRTFAPPTTPCGETSCIGSTISGELCNGLGGCGLGQASCAPNQCRDGLCSNSCRSGLDCAENAFCSPSGFCAPKRRDGAICQNDSECTSRFCSDGVCCNAPCNGQCEWCVGENTAGTCTAVVGEPRRGRAACSVSQDENPCVTAKCDGVERSRCTDVVTECGAYACEKAGGCKRSCTRQTAGGDCAPDAICLEPEGRCIQTDLCDPDQCSPFKCPGAGPCVTRCTSSLECVAGHACTSRGECAQRETHDDFGCACQTVALGPTPPVWWIAAFLLLGRCRRRRPARAGNARCSTTPLGPPAR